MDVGVLLDQGPSLVLGCSESKGKTDYTSISAIREKVSQFIFQTKKDSLSVCSAFPPETVVFIF